MLPDRCVVWLNLDLAEYGAVSGKKKNHAMVNTNTCHRTLHSLVFFSAVSWHDERGRVRVRRKKVRLIIASPTLPQPKTFNHLKYFLPPKINSSCRTFSPAASVRVLLLGLCSDDEDEEEYVGTAHNLPKPIDSSRKKRINKGRWRKEEVSVLNSGRIFLIPRLRQTIAHFCALPYTPTAHDF